jgi:hypothetical protein
MRRRFLALAALACAIALGVSGCTAIIVGGGTILPTLTPTQASTPGPGTPTVAPTTGPGTPSPTPSGPTPTPATGPKGSAKLTKAPTGQAHLTYDPNTQNLSIQTTLTTLAPNSPHAMNIRAGNCISTGPVLVTLPNVTADAVGNVNTSSSQMVQPTTEPSSGWYIEVTNGIGSSVYDTLNLVCANIGATQGGTGGAPVSSSVQFTQGVGPSMNASGNATFTLANTQLTVKLTVSGLEPGSQHAAFVSQGTCQNQSAPGSVHGLQPLHGDNSGNASSTTVISPVQSAPSTAWYVIVTRGTNLSSFIDAAPIACGNVTVSQ